MDDQNQGEGNSQDSGVSSQSNQGLQPVAAFVGPSPVLDPPPVAPPPVAPEPLPLPKLPPVPELPPAVPPVEVPAIVEALPWVAFLALLLTPCPTAPPWMDELNPITGGPYKSKEEYEAIRQFSPEEIRKRAAEYRRQQLAKAQADTRKTTCESPVGSSTEPCPPARRNPGQTCDDAVLNQLQKEKDQLAISIPPLDPASPNSRNPKRMAKVPCSRLKQRLQALEALLAKRWEIQNTCFGGKPDKAHQDEINALNKAIEFTKKLADINCASGYPTATK